MGLGKYGNAVVEELFSDTPLLRRVAVCLTQKELENVNIETKFQVSKRLRPEDAVERIHRKIEKACTETDVVIIIANPIDFPNPEIIYMIAEYIQKLNIVPVGVIINPSGKIDRKHRNAIRETIGVMFSYFASVIIPQKSVAKYIAEINSWWLESYADDWLWRDVIQEQAEFQKWKQSLEKKIDNLPAEVQVGTFIVCRLIDIITLEYSSADETAIRNILSISGHLHFTTVYATGKRKCDLVQKRTAFNDVLHTTSHAAAGMLLTLTVPKTMTSEEVGKVCLGIYSYADENVNFHFNINFSEQDDVVLARVLATGTYDISEFD